MRRGVVAPLGLPAPTLAALRSALVKVADDADTKRRLTQAGVEPFNLDAAAFVSFLSSDRARWAEIAARDSI